MSFSMYSQVESGDANYCFLYINGIRLWETSHRTYSETGVMRSTGGRVVTVEASAGDRIEIRADGMDDDYYEILYCAEFIPKM